MPTFKDADQVNSACWQMKQADYHRGRNRARINELFNGFPPYSDQEVEENNIVVNVNFLESTKLAHDARSQFYNAFMKPGNYFTARTDCGPIHRRQKWGAIVTREMNRRMKRSTAYFECYRSAFAQDVLHGIGPSTWPDDEMWCPDPCGVEDVLVPGNTLLTLRNLPFFALYKSFSYPELLAVYNKRNPDPGWNKEMVKECLTYIDTESVRMMGTNWPEIWSPEKLSERLKSDGGFYMGDQIPTIECFDFYFYDGDSKTPGWRRRIVLDSWAVGPDGKTMTRKTGEVYKNDRAFLYDGKTRRFSECHKQIIHFQFADLSAVAPFRYHSIRSLGFLLYAVCHLQNRMRCRMNEAVFEALMMYFRVKSMDDAQRALKLELINRGFIEDGIDPVRAQDRYQVNAPLVQFGLQQNQQIINENSSSYVQNPNYSQGGVEKTKFQVMAETNAMTSLVSAALTQAYTYQTDQYREIFRRFCRPLSKDPDVKSFRAACLSQGVPEKYLVEDLWELEPERVMGAGNKTLEMTIAQQLMEWRPMFDPEPQRDILRDAVLAITDDAAKADSLVPEAPMKVTDSVHDAQLTAAALLAGNPVGMKTGMNHIEYVQTMLISFGVAINKAKQRGNMATAEEIQGMQNLAQHIAEHIQIIAQDKREKQLAATFGNQLGMMMNEVKGFAQRLMQQMQKQAEENGRAQDPETMAKIQAMMMQAEAKRQNTRESHAERTAQRQIQFEMQQDQKRQEHDLDMQRKAAELQADLVSKGLETQADVLAKRMKSQPETEK